jgi:hypothetical protein
MRQPTKRTNPWELLVIGVLFILPGSSLLLQKKPVLLINSSTWRARWTQPISLSPAEAHFFGYCAVAVGVLLTVLYFYTRSAIAREERASPPRFLESRK